MGKGRIMAKQQKQQGRKVKTKSVSNSKAKMNGNTAGDASKRKKGFAKSWKGKKTQKDDSGDEEFEIASSFNAEEVKPGNVDETDVLEEGEMAKEQRKKQKKSGGFQSMGLSYPVYKGIIRKGYKVPTPIQRKAIPVLMDGKDVVAMARTGSGKTAAFLLPLFEKLKTHSTKGARALILSPTRELAAQTMKFIKELGKYTDLKACMILGGDSMEDQFASLHQNPDIVIATPGRFLHVLVEMGIKQLEFVEYVVFDEADRLFEMGFSEQLHEIIGRLPGSRQTVLVSATLPKMLVDFAAAGLTDPTLIRLDVYNKISEKLKMAYFLLRHDDKLACLLYILHTLVKVEEQTIVFVSTKHHVDYLQQLLTLSGFNCSYIYSSLDQTARKINIAKFQKKITKVLIVTDIAARGIDIPMLDNVVNYDFPSKPKLFVHRVGRVARAGRAGMAYSFVTKDEMAYLIDLHLFLTEPLLFATVSEDEGNIGTVPQDVLLNHHDFLKNTTQHNFTLSSMHKVMSNGYKHYVRSREIASTASIKRAKEINYGSIHNHHIFKDTLKENSSLTQLRSALQNFKPKLTVFEAMNTKKSKEKEGIMKAKRLYHSNVIETVKAKVKNRKTEEGRATSAPTSSLADDNYIADVFPDKKKDSKDENYIPHRPVDFNREKGLNLTSFEKEAKSVSMEIGGDDEKLMKTQHTSKKWDRKRKKFVSTDGNKAKKIKTESGNYIPSSYKSKVYGEWKKKNCFLQNNENEGDNTVMKFQRRKGFKGTNKNVTSNNKKAKGMLRSRDEIIKNRLTANRRKSFPKKSGGKRR